MKLPGILARIMRHAALFEAMTEKLGIGDRLAALDDAPSVYRRAHARCLTCSQGEACGKWLDIALDPKEAPDYCKNKSLFARLERLSDRTEAPDSHGSGSRRFEQAL